ncbi:flagellar assembly protein FliH [Campylobacter concisus]|uniref:flagellar assembly protein FliH n=1 Tax=Campylobacter concisus TaxID=199 RepID=UPI000CD972CE|nr:flagellar assembly protein FliH [Campylobacter concisus]MCA6129674.1 flagellar assembly protein FliH [Campylobacter concisus]MCA6131747.1 flagellar assembly protein FliH [Campylobacter concisus]
MKSSVITSETSPAHFIENYRFKVLGSNERAQDSAPVLIEENNLSEELNEQNLEQGGENFTPQSQPVHQMQPNMQNHFAPQSQNSQAHQPGFDSSFVEELLKKTDELSSNIIKLQMQIENQESEFAKRLEAEIARAKEDGKNEGIAQTNAANEAKIKELEAKFSASAAKLDEQYVKFDEFLKKSEEELGQTAIKIAKEVIEKEVSSASSQIAHHLANSLIKELSDVKNIEIRVNPEDSDYLKEQFSKNERIKVSADDAISKGGVVIISEGGNIDATMQTRLEKLKMLVNNE